MDHFSGDFSSADRNAAGRLAQSKVCSRQTAHERGYANGSQWAEQKAEYCELESLASNWPTVGTTETQAEYGSAGAFLDMTLGEDRPDMGDFLEALRGLLEYLGKSHSDDAYSSDYWDGFAEGALEVFDQLD